MLLVWHSMTRVVGVGVSVSSPCPGEAANYIINYVIHNNSFSHLTLVH